MFTLAKKYYLIKTKTLKALKKYYNNPHWIIFSAIDNLYIKDVVYNTHQTLDIYNYKEQFNQIKINKKVILIGKYHHILPIYQYLKQQNIKVFNIYL